MRKAIHHLGVLALAAGLCFIGTSASNATPFQLGDRDSDVTRAEIAGFDRFLDTHPGIAADLQKNPSLANDDAYLDHHTALGAYLNDHPQIRVELQENPRAFINTEARFDRNEPREPRKVEDNIARLDAFLDYHPEIAGQLAKDPSLVDNPQYLKNHPDLQQYLQEHPSIREQIDAHPAAFMAAEARYDASGRDVNRAELETWVAFMDTHQNIAQELAKNPSLADNASYINSHPAFQEFLARNPGIHGELIENTQEFMSEAANYGRRGNGAPTHVNYRYPGAVSEFDSFLDRHPAIAQELYRNPSLAENQEYLQSHTDLQEYLQSHPNISQQLAANPRGFMDAERRYDRLGDEARVYSRMGSAARRGVVDNDTTPGEIRAFGGFLEDHPEVAEQLRAHPSMINDQTYVGDHPQLQSFLRNNPQVAEEVKENPQVFMNQLRSLHKPEAAATSTGTTSTPRSAATEQQAVPKLTPNPPR